MNKLLAALALMLAVGAHAADISYSVTVPGTKDNITAFPGHECRSSKVIQLVRESGAGEAVPSLQHAESVFDGKKYEACFVETNGNLIVVYEDGQVGIIPKQLFTLNRKI